MPRLQVKLFSSPDHERTFPLGSAQVVALDDTTIGLARWEPGWRWTTHLAPIAGTSSCQVHHLGYAISGRLHVVMDDGQSLEIPGNSAYEIPSGHDATVVGDEPFVTLEWTSANVVGMGVEGGNERIVATVLFTDIVNSTATLEAMGDARWRDVLGEHNRRIRDLLNRYRGREIDTTGDGFLALFDSASRAVRSGQAMAADATAMGIEIRVGVHTGEVELVGDKVEGIAVHIGARITAEARPCEVLVSRVVRDLAAGSSIEFEDRGVRQLKGVPGDWQLFAARLSERARLG
jgi:class 3 adenylate cyclase